MKDLNFELPHNFHALFTPEVTELIVTSLQQAYDDAAESFQPELGDDQFTYGNKIWRFGTHQLKDNFANRVDLAVIFEKQNRLRLKIGNFVVGINKIGHTGKENINESYPNNTKNIESLAIDQTQLSFFDIALNDQGETVEYEKVQLNNLIIGHMGNLQDGLRAVYFCFPFLDNDETIVKWAHTIKVWDANENVNLTDIGYIPPAEETVEAPVLTLKEDLKGISLNE